MTVKLTVGVTDITATLLAGFTHIKVYRSAEETSGFVEITTPNSLVPLVSGDSSYDFYDYNGTTEHWYRTTFYDASTPQESAFSASFYGEFVDTGFGAITYPEEGIYTNNDRLVIDKIRTLIGDRKELTRDYVSADTGYTSISLDERTHTLSNPRGWPVSVSLNSVFYTSKDEPYVNDYQFITFSGSTISTVSGTLDLWYYHFRNSDSEILRVFNALVPPAPLEAEDVTFELAIICAAIEILSGELRLSSSSAGLEVDIFEEIRINPKGGLDSRFNDLKLLTAQKGKIIEEILNNTEDELFGVLID